MFDLISFIPRAVAQSIPLLFGSTGETITEKSGNLNLGIPGVMYVGAISGVIGSFLYEQSTTQMNGVVAILIPLLSCLAGLSSDGTSVLLPDGYPAGQPERHRSGHDHLRRGLRQLLRRLSDQADRQRGAFHRALRHQQLLPQSPSLRGKLGWVGTVFFSYGFLAYLAIIIALAASYILKHTRTGLHLRAVGENPATADAAGINITRYKYMATCLGCMTAGLGGLYYVMDYANGVWSNDASATEAGLPSRWSSSPSGGRTSACWHPCCSADCTSCICTSPAA